MFWVAAPSIWSGPCFVLVWKHSPQRWMAVLLRATTRVHMDAGCYHPINIHQQRSKANMFPLSDFTIDAARKTSAGCLSCIAHTDGNSSPKQIMVRKQHHHLQTRLWLDVTVRRWVRPSTAGLHDESIFSIILWPVVLFSTLSWSRPPCFPWLQLIMSKHKFDSAEWPDLTRTSASVVRLSFSFHSNVMLLYCSFLAVDTWQKLQLYCWKTDHCFALVWILQPGFLNSSGNAASSIIIVYRKWGQDTNTIAAIRKTIFIAYLSYL